ncbi:MAG: ATP-binding protein [Nitrospirota bacterium]
MTSIRRFLTSRLLLAAVFLLAAGHVALYLFVHHRLTAHFDASLTARARAFAGMMEQDFGGIEIDLREEFLPEYRRGEDSDYFQVWGESGEVIERSPSLEEQDLPRRAGTLEAPLIWNLTLPDGRPGRAIGVAFLPYVDEMALPQIGTRTRVEVVLARDRLDVLNMMNILLFGSGIVILAFIGGIFLIVHRVTRAGLSPLNRLADHTATIHSESLGSRYQAGNLPDELRPIVSRLNELLQRLETAFEREKRLTADIAHELKTPIAELRAHSEVALKWPEDHPFVQKALSETVEISNQMNNMVSLLLSLNRCESGKQAISLSTLDLPAMIVEQWEPWRRAAEKKRIGVKFDLHDATTVVTDRTMLASILMNLFSNAVEYCPEHGRLECAMERRDQAIVVTVRNSDASLAESDLTRLFDKLWRKDPSRGGTGHSGLGLALVSAFARSLDIGIETELQDGLFSISLSIPPPPAARGGTS